MGHSQGLRNRLAEEAQSERDALSLLRRAREHLVAYSGGSAAITTHELIREIDALLVAAIKPEEER